MIVYFDLYVAIQDKKLDASICIVAHTEDSASNIYNQLSAKMLVS